ncbi:MAG: metal-dependent hydrolase [Candidatus Hodarchaeales archaeon]
MNIVTWFSTHLALESLFVWMLIGSNLRENYLKTRKTSILFIFTSLAALGPDLDYIIRILTDWIPGAESILNIFYHRGATHSIFFPLLFVLIGLSIISYYNYSRPDQASNPNFSFSKLVGYSFILASLFWGMHLILDIDSAEGGMVLFWPFDNGVYQPKILLELLAYPFFLLPWTPLGIKIDVNQSTLQSLQSYLLNWTPDQIIDYFGKPEFSLLLAGLILHLIIFLLYLNYVIKPIISGLRIKPITLFPRIREKLKNFKLYWKRVSKYLLVSSLIFLVIGFSLGPMLGSEIHDSKTVRSTIRFTNTTFSPSAKIIYNPIHQPLDPEANHEFSFQIKSINIENASLAIIFAHHDLILDWENNISQEFDQTENLTSIINSTDQEFKNSYQQSVNNLLINPSIIESETNIVNPINISKQIKTDQELSFGIILYDWVSPQYWNQTDLSVFVEYSLNIVFHRTINFLIGVIMQSLGMIALIVVLIKPLVKKQENIKETSEYK